MEGGRGAARGKRRGGVGLEEGGRDGGGEGGDFRDRSCNYICQSTPRHLDRQRSRFPSVFCCHHIDGGTTREGEGEAREAKYTVCMFARLHAHFYVCISMCLRTVLQAPWVVCASVLVYAPVGLQGNKPGHSGGAR